MKLIVATDKGAVVKQWDDIPGESSLCFWTTLARSLDTEDRVADATVALLTRS